MKEQHKIGEWYVSRQDQIAETVKNLLPRAFEHAQDDDYQFWKDQNLVIEVDTFFNCREAGYTYKLLGAKQPLVFCVYEHRNSDSIIINGCFEKDVKVYGPYNGESKWDYLETFSYNAYDDVAEKLAQMLLDSYKGVYDESKLKEVIQE